MAESELLLSEETKEQEEIDLSELDSLVRLNLRGREIFSPSQMVDAILRLRADPDDQFLREKIVISNLGLVYYFARRVLKDKANIGILGLQDLAQEGTLGLMAAIERFDPGLGYRFSTYAGFWIRQKMQRAIQDSSQTIRVPAHMDEKLRKILVRRRAMTQELGREPRIEEVANAMGITPARSLGIHKAWISHNPSSLDAVISDKEHPNYVSQQTLGDAIPSPGDPNPDKEIVKQQILDILSQRLTPREKKVMILRFGIEDGIPKTLEQVGREFGRTRERIRQIEAVAIRKLQRCRELKSLHKDLTP